MKKIAYGKLVRDLIPDILVKKRKAFGHKILHEKDYSGALRKKIVEEAGELAEARSREETVKELADLLEVVESLQEAEGITSNELVGRRTEKQSKVGGFRKRIFLEWTEDDGYEENKRQA